ncbi:MAG TPA: hypothetical protein QGH10_05685 [Armatimonadota bacterium]|nr:hypothetical protein [Armatimonadota bacterium]
MDTQEACIAETNGRGAHIQLDLGGPKIIDRVLLVEDTRRGQNVREYVVEGRGFSGWTELARGADIGDEKTDCFDPVTVLKIRLLVKQSSARPIIRRLAVFAPRAEQGDA